MLDTFIEPVITQFADFTINLPAKGRSHMYPHCHPDVIGYSSLKNKKAVTFQSIQ
jgi:hypothetical protein